MISTVTCPRCGSENSIVAMNCVSCGINLKFAQENPSEIDQLKQDDARRSQSEAGAMTTNHTGEPHSKQKPILLPVLLLLGSFVFAFCLGEAVHELGHYLAHRAYGVNVAIRLDPFGGSMILNGSSAPQEIWGITSLAGPLFNLLVGMAITLSLWRVRVPILLPLVLWGPVALVQEGVTFSLGMLTPGGDARLIVAWGIPAFVVISLGILFLASGIAMICWLLPLVNLSPADSIGRKFSVVVGGMVSFFVIRLVFSSMRSSSPVLENTVPLVFSILLAAIVASLYKPLNAIQSRMSKTKLAPVTWPATILSITLGAGMILFQLASLN
jgi:hypothetical protein